MYSNKVDLVKIISRIPYKYCVIRMSEHFPNYESGSDIDILCENANRIANYLTLNLDNTRVVYTKTNKVHVDVLDENDKLDIKFDLMDNFDCYKKTKVYPSFIPYILSSLTWEAVYDVRIPNIHCELALRYLEYVEKPKKVKHLKYIQDNANSNKYKNILSVFTDMS